MRRRQERLSLRSFVLQGIAAAAAGPTAPYGDCVEVLLPLVQQLARDPEAEIRATAVKQLPGLGRFFVYSAMASAVVCTGCVVWLRRQACMVGTTLAEDLVSWSCAGTALFHKDAEHSMRDIEATLLVCAQQCALDDDEEVGLGICSCKSQQ